MSPLNLNALSSGDGRYDSYDTVTLLLVGLFCPLTTIAVALRFVARRKTKAKLWWDDWMALVSLIFFYGFSALGVIAAGNGSGSPDILLVPWSNLVVLAQAVFAGPCVSSACITSTKTTALLLYARLFKQDKTFKIAVAVISVFGVAWYVASILAWGFRCTPAYYAFDPIQALGPNCYDLRHLFIATEVPNCVLDFVVVILPVVILRKIKLRLRDKLMLSFIFLLGGLVCVVSIARMIQVYTVDGFAFINLSGRWLLGQQAAAILCVCLPTYKPLFSAISVPSRVHKAYSPFSHLNSQSRRTESSAINHAPLHPNSRKKYLHQSTSTTSTVITAGTRPPSPTGRLSSFLAPFVTATSSLASFLKRALLPPWRPAFNGTQIPSHSRQEAWYRTPTMPSSTAGATPKLNVHIPTTRTRTWMGMDLDKALPATPEEVVALHVLEA